MLASTRYIDELVKRRSVRLFAKRSLMVDWTDNPISAP
jgi:hypothetical protein